MWLPCLLCVTVGTAIWPEINNVFGLQLASGFLGGHGTAAAVGTTLAEMGYENAGDIGMTFATVGILTGIFGGIIYIKWATAKGYTQYIKMLSVPLRRPEDRHDEPQEPGQHGPRAC